VGGQCGKKNLLPCEDSSAVNFSYSTALLYLYTSNTTHFHTDPAVAGFFAVEVLPCLKLAFLLLLGSLMLPISLLGKRCVLTACRPSPNDTIC
jgi:hypothetical protein